MSYAMMVRESVSEYSELEIIDAHKLYKEKLENISEKAYCEPHQPNKIFGWCFFFKTSYTLYQYSTSLI
jgi:hypothetical protein